MCLPSQTLCLPYLVGWIGALKLIVSFGAWFWNPARTVRSDWENYELLMFCGSRGPFIGPFIHFRFYSLCLPLISYTFVCSAFLGLSASHVGFGKWKLERKFWYFVSFKALSPTWYDDTSYHLLFFTCIGTNWCF